MPVMSAIEGAFCRSAIWQTFAHRVVLPWALNNHQLSGDVLEIGCGGGAMADVVARVFPDLRLTATDIDEAMVASARRRLTGRGNVGVEQADVTALPFDGASFDAVTSYLMLHHVVTWREALAEVARVLRPGGLVVGYDLTDTRLARATHRLDGSPHLILSADQVREGLETAGFGEIVVRTSAAGHLMRFRATHRTHSEAS